MDDLKLRESIKRAQLQAKNTRLREKLEEKTKLSTMESLFIVVIQCGHPSKSYVIFLKE